MLNAQCEMNLLPTPGPSHARCMLKNNMVKGGENLRSVIIFNDYQ